jgi:hypothetical protein
VLLLGGVFLFGVLFGGFPFGGGVICSLTYLGLEFLALLDGGPGPGERESNSPIWICCSGDRNYLFQKWSKLWVHREIKSELLRARSSSACR